MSRQNNYRFYPSSLRRPAAPAYEQTPGRIPQEFREAMKRLPGKAAETPRTRTPDSATKDIQRPLVRKRTAKESVDKWKSSFKPVGHQDEDDDDEDQSASSSEKVELYDPYDLVSSDPETEIRQKNNHDSPLSVQKLNPQQSSARRSRWDIPSCGTASAPVGSGDLRTNPRPEDGQGLSLGRSLPEQQSCSSHTHTCLDQPLYVPLSGEVDRNVHGHDRVVFLSHGEPNNMEDRRRDLEHSREATTKISAPKVLDYNHHSRLVEKGLDPVPSATDNKRNRSKTVILDKNPVTCDLCDVELATAQDLEDHLESRVHWGTLEYIQENNHYDDLVIAFLQEVMTYKSRQSSRAIEESAFQALEENDHMTRVEVFHCSACRVFVSSSAFAVQEHITSREHLSNTQLFRVQQRRICLDRAGTIMKELALQFELFRKGERAFE
ncbi:A-kinase anchor protein 8-like isoform X3 [Cynoglossus semilaevis]|uniref:Zinc finger protein 326 n=1 Tax=Cynoglossus semilaevis TaxID=244447 RepID=A0A3P8WMB7_CYNSE|nr:DBIRD complex subunit ZNF326 isoform X3 [Cynoglossus semilaevis]